MKKLLLSAALILCMSAEKADACTNFIVAKGASADGSVMVTYNADDYGMFQSLCHYPAMKHKKGEMRQVYDWDTGEYRGQIPEAEETYNVIGNINEYQVSIAETTYGGREEMADSTGILDYGSLIYIALQRSKTAREAIQVMTSLVEKYGYFSEGETFSICDPDEAWIMEMQGKGATSAKTKFKKGQARGAVWVAIRIPDNAICAHANQSRITKFLQIKDTEVIYSKDVIKYARQMGWYDGKDEDFSWNEVYAFPDFSGRRFCEARVWSFFNHWSSDMNKYLDYAMGKVKGATPMPLWIVPNKKISVADMENCMRDHYEGTPFALDEDIAQGIWASPYRPTPLSFEVDGKKYFNERPTSTQQSGFTFVAQMRNWLPREIGGILWFGNDDANMVAYTPVYCASTVRPECYNTPGADGVTFSYKNAFWVCNWVANMTYPRYAQLFPSVKEVRDSLEQSYFANQKAVEDKAKQLYDQNPAAAVKYLNDYTVETAQQMLARWNQLAIYLIVKYNDMAVRPEKDGKFLRNKVGMPERVQRPGYGYSEWFKKKYIETTGDKYAVPEE